MASCDLCLRKLRTLRVAGTYINPTFPIFSESLCLRGSLLPLTHNHAFSTFSLVQEKEISESRSFHIPLRIPAFELRVRCDGSREPIPKSFNRFNFGLGSMGMRGWWRSLQRWQLGTCHRQSGKLLVLSNSALLPLTVEIRPRRCASRRSTRPKQGVRRPGGR